MEISDFQMKTESKSENTPNQLGIWKPPSLFQLKGLNSDKLLYGILFCLFIKGIWAINHFLDQFEPKMPLPLFIRGNGLSHRLLWPQ